MKKKIVLALLISSAIASLDNKVGECNNALSEMGSYITFEMNDYMVDAYDAASIGAEKIFPYQEETLYKVYMHSGFVTDIKLKSDEKVTYIGGGDTVRWKIDTDEQGTLENKRSHVFIKPLENGLSTNIIINTDKRTYRILATSGSGYNPVISFQYPKSDIKIKEEKEFKKYNTINPIEMKFGYKISEKDYAWSPVDVFRTENKTYLKMKKEIENSELPAFFVIDDDDKPLLVSYRYKDGYLIIDRVIDEGILVLGKKKIKIKYKGND